MIPVVAEPEVAPAQNANAPIQVTDTQAAVRRVAKNASPEEDVSSNSAFIFLPMFRKQFGVVAQVIENITVQEYQSSVFELLTEFVSDDRLVTHLTF